MPSNKDVAEHYGLSSPSYLETPLITEDEATIENYLAMQLLDLSQNTRSMFKISPKTYCLTLAYLAGGGNAKSGATKAELIEAFELGYADAEKFHKIHQAEADEKSKLVMEIVEGLFKRPSKQ